MQKSPLRFEREKIMDNLKKVIALIQRFMEKKWFGKLEISLEAGNIVNVKVTENIKL
jgi:hypothetical protein